MTPPMTDGPHSDSHTAPPSDLWGDPAEEMVVLQADMLATDPDDHRRLAYMLYMLGRYQLATGNHQAAAKVFLDSYTLVPEFRPVLRTARMLYQERRDVRLVVKLLGAEAVVSRDPQAAASLLRRQAHLRWSQLNDVNDARRSLKLALEREPGDPVTLRLMALLAAADHDTELLRLNLTQEARHGATDGALQAALLVNLALISARSDPEAALRALREAGALDPDNSTVLCFLQQLLQQERHDGELATVLLRQAEAGGVSASHRARLLARAGRLARDQLDNEADAAALLQRSLEAEPVFGVAADCFELLLSLERHQDAAVVGEMLFGLDRPAGLGPRLACQLGDLQLYHLQQPPAALKWYERSLEQDPCYRPALEGAGRVLEQTEELERLLAHHRTELEAVSDAPQRARLLWRMGDLLERAGQLNEAVDAHREALTQVPAFAPGVYALERLYRDLGRWPELLQLLAEALGRVHEAQQAMELLERMADIWIREMDQPQSALECLEGILNRDPDHLPAMRAAARICAHSGAWQELIELSEQEAALTEGLTRRLELLCQMGQIRWHRLDDPVGAQDYYRRALELVPAHLPALLALTQLYRAEGRLEELARLLRSQLQSTPSEERKIELLYELARVAHQRDDGEQAVAAMREVLMLDRRQHSAALELAQGQVLAGDWETARLVLEGMQLADEPFSPGEGPTDPDGTVRVAVDPERAGDTELSGPGRPGVLFDAPIKRPRSLRRQDAMLRNNHLVEELEPVLERRIEQTGDALDLACLWTERAELRLEASDEDGAEQAFLEALSFHGGHPTALWGLARMLERQGRWSELAELAEQEAEALEAGGGKLDAILRAAVTWEERVEDVERAMQLYLRILQQAPLHREAFRRLSVCYSARQEFGALASLVRARISHSDDAAKTARLFHQLGQIYVGQLGQPQKGIACLYRALELEPGDLPNLTLLADLLYDREEYEEAEQLYRRCQSAVEDAAEIARLNRRRGEIHLQLGRPRPALDSLTLAASATSCPDADLLRLVADAARAAGDTAAMVKAMEMLAQLSQDTAERATVHKELSQVAVELDDDTLALRSLEQALELDPLDIEAIERMAAIFGSKGDRVAVERHLRQAIRRHIEQLQTDALQPKLYKQLGRIFQWQREYDRFYCSCVVRQHLEGHGKGLMDDAERRFLQAHHYRCAPIPTGPLAQDRYEELILGEVAGDPLRKVLVAARRGLQQRIANSPEALGLGRDSQVGTSHPLKVLCDEIAALLGRPRFEVHITSSRPELIAAEMLDWPALIIGERVARNLITAPQRFRLGRALFLIAENALVLHDMSERRTRVLLGALGEVATPRCPLEVKGADPAAIKVETSKLTRLLDRQEREKLGSVLPELGGKVEPVDLSAFKRSLRLAANRAGLLAGGDPQKCLEQAAILTEEEGGSRELENLLLYLVSDHYYKLRALLALKPE